MSLSKIKKRNSVELAVKEFGEVGREGFLEMYGFGEARQYFLEIDGNLYDSKAIIAAAHGYEFPELGPLTSPSFSGGEKTVAAKLRQLGFKVKKLGKKQEFPPVSKTHFWIFQGNPKQFKVDDYVNTFETIQWSVRQKHLAKYMNVGDIVFIWRSDGYQPDSGGIIAKSKITSLPSQMNDDAQEFWVIRPKKLVELRVKLRVQDRMGLAKELNRTVLARAPSLRGLLIFRMRNETNYLLTDEQGKYIDSLWNKAFNKTLSEIEDGQFQEAVQRSSFATLEKGPIPRQSKISVSKGRKWAKDPRVAKSVLDSKGYICELEGNHRTFTSRITGKNFVEAHHLIPMECQDEFDYSLDVESNIVSLCPNCHRLLHHAKIDEKLRVLGILFEQRKEGLERQKITVGLDWLQKAYSEP